MQFQGIEDPAKLRRLLEAVLLLEADLSLPSLLRRTVEEACAVAGAAYGAFGVLDAERTGLSEVVTAGVDRETESAIGARLAGLGVLGLLIADPRPLRLDDIATHPDRAGFPPGGPPMTSFLGVPVLSGGEVYGHLYLAEKVGWSEFTEDDEVLVTALAHAAGIAIENARLRQREQEMAVVEDRNRIAESLHDSVVQRLLAIGLSLQGVPRPSVSAEVADRLLRAVDDIDQTIDDVRSSIFELGSAAGPRGLKRRVREAAREMADVVGFEVPVVFDGPVDLSIDDELAGHLLAAVREVLTHVGRLRPTRAWLRVRVGGTCVVEIVQEGQDAGDTPVAPGADAGLAGLRERAEGLGGEVVVADCPGGATVLTWTAALRP
ncbi:MAG TPA: GAF domain-containing protein [Acidimicrobiales bacterium]|nr:GAF domain-containing protein [Acidimicrobiales bacterium]